MLNDTARFESHVDRSGGPDACHPWTSTIDRYGYGQFKMDGRTRGAHQVAWEFAHGGKLPPGMQVDHECHNKAVLDGSCQPGECLHRRCCNERHLKSKTAKQNKNAQPYGSPRGEARYWNVKLTDAQVAEVRVLLAARVRYREIARIYGVSEDLIGLIKRGKHRSESKPNSAA